MRTDVEFSTEDRVMLRGWHYRPDRGRGPWPTIVMAHGFSAVKEMYLDRFAEAFAAAGLAALVFDNRNFGASDGEPRQEIDPWRQIADYRGRDQLRADAARDRRPAHRGLGLQLQRRACAGARRHGSAHQMRRVAGAADQRLSQCAPADPRRRDRRGRGDVRRGSAEALSGRAAGDLPVVSEDPAGPAALPTPDPGSGSRKPAGCGRLPGRTW